MGKDERIQRIVESWQGPNRIQEDTWENVKLVLDHYGFTYERKKEWVCTHEEFVRLARNPRAKDLLRSVKLGTKGEFEFAITHGARRKAGMILRCYLNDILRYIDLLNFIQRRKAQS